MSENQNEGLYAEIDSLRGRLREIEELEKSPAFLNLLKGLQAQIDSMQTQIVLKPLAGLDETFAQEYRKGQIEGRLSLANLLANQREEVEYEIEQRKKELKDDDETEV